MRHRLSLVIDQSNDDPEDQIADAEALAEYLREAVRFRVERGHVATVSLGGTGFDIDPDSIIVEDIDE